MSITFAEREKLCINSIESAGIIHIVFHCHIMRSCYRQYYLSICIVFQACLQQPS